MSDTVQKLYRIEIRTPTGWVTRDPTYTSQEFARRDAQGEVARFGDTLRIVEFTRSATENISVPSPS